MRQTTTAISSTMEEKSNSRVYWRVAVSLEDPIQFLGIERPLHEEAEEDRHRGIQDESLEHVAKQHDPLPGKCELLSHAASYIKSEPPWKGYPACGVPPLPGREGNSC